MRNDQSLTLHFFEVDKSNQQKPMGGGVSIIGQTGGVAVWRLIKKNYLFLNMTWFVLLISKLRYFMYCSKPLNVACGVYVSVYELCMRRRYCHRKQFMN